MIRMLPVCSFLQKSSYFYHMEQYHLIRSVEEILNNLTRDELVRVNREVLSQVTARLLKKIENSL